MPSIALSGYAGQFADRNSKRYVSVLVKLAELPIAAVALVGFWIGNLWITLSAMVALTCQSAYFGPAKYGMIPELVDSRELSRANGAINMMTNLAVIVGTLAAGQVADLYSPRPVPAGTAADPVLWLPGAAMLAVAAAGLAAVLFLPPLEPGNRALKYDLNPLATYTASLKDMARSPLLCLALIEGGPAKPLRPEYSHGAVNSPWRRQIHETAKDRDDFHGVKGNFGDFFPKFVETSLEGMAAFPTLLAVL